MFGKLFKRRPPPPPTPQESLPLHLDEEPTERLEDIREASSSRDTKAVRSFRIDDDPTWSAPPPLTESNDDDVSASRRERLETDGDRTPVNRKLVAAETSPRHRGTIRENASIRSLAIRHGVDLPSVRVFFRFACVS